MVFNHIKFAPDNGFDALLGSFGYELKNPEHIAVIGDGHGRHIVGFSLVNQLLNIGLPIEQGVLGMAMEVRELHTTRFIGLKIGFFARSCGMLTHQKREVL